MHPYLLYPYLHIPVLCQSCSMTNIPSLISVESTDFLSISVGTNFAGVQSITLTAVDDDIALENDTFLLNYVHIIGEKFVDVVEVRGEFVRHLATVEIIDNDRKYSEPPTICMQRNTFH